MDYLKGRKISLKDLHEIQYDTTIAKHSMGIITFKKIDMHTYFNRNGMLSVLYLVYDDKDICIMSTHRIDEAFKVYNSLKTESIFDTKS